MMNDNNIKNKENTAKNARHLRIKKWPNNWPRKQKNSPKLPEQTIQIFYTEPLMHPKTV